MTGPGDQPRFCTAQERQIKVYLNEDKAYQRLSG
jgi:hypothetical protein